MPKLTHTGVAVSNKREAILDAALELFAARGVDHTSMSDLASAVGIRKASLYYYFSGKEELVDSILASSHFKAEDTRQLLQNDDEPIAARLNRLGTAMLEAMRRRPGYQALLRREVSIDDDSAWRAGLRKRLREHVEGRIAVLAEVLQDVAPHVGRQTAHILASQFYHSLTNFLSFEWNTTRRVPSRSRIQQYVRIQTSCLMLFLDSAEYVSASHSAADETRSND